MHQWNLVLLIVFLAIIGSTVIEYMFPSNVEPLTVGCTCVRWRDRREPSGYRVVRDTACPVHNEGN